MKLKINSSRFTFLVIATAFFFQANSVFLRAQSFYYWYNIGPQPINNLDSDKITEPGSGRVTTLAVDPFIPSHWLIGAAQGGIWETTDAGISWIPRTDSQASLAMGAIAFAPANSLLVFAGTGEPNFRGDAYAGAGLLVSHNGGTTWQMLNPNFAKSSFSHIRVNPSDSGTLVVATVRGGAGIGEESSGYGNVPGAPPRGVFVSTNGGALFARLLTGEATALEANLNNFSQQYAGLGEIYGDPTNGVYRTTNSWQTFESIPGPWIMTNTTYTYTNYPIATNIYNTNTVFYTNIVYTNYVTGTNMTVGYAGGRITMASSPSDPNTLYVGIAGIRNYYLANMYGIWVTTNAWDTSPNWTQLPNPSVLSDNISTPRFWYMFDLLVDPADPTEVYLAEFDVWRYASGEWTCLAGWETRSITPVDPHVHPDNHAMAWVPESAQSYRMLLGNDGGVFLSSPGVNGVWTSKNAHLNITQFYKGAVDPTGANVLALGGAQDMFTSVYYGSTAWSTVNFGDGGDCAISAANPLNYWAVSADMASDNYSSKNEVPISRTLNAGLDNTAGASTILDGLPFSEQFYVHFEKAPYQDNLLIAGTATLWRCDNFFSGIPPAWYPNSPTMLDTNGAPVPISAMAFAPSNANGLIYAFGTEDGQLRITSNGGGLWTDPDPAKTLPGRYVSGLAFSPGDPNTLYVTYSGFDESTPGHAGHLFKTTDALAATPTWKDVSPPVDLPNNCVATDPNLPGLIYVGTDIGIWYSADGAGTWTHYGPSSGMPNVAVYDLRLNSNGQVTAFTHGRGAYLLAKINIPILVFVAPNPYLTPNCLTCPPDQAWLNPGDEVSIEITLQGILPVDTLNLKVTLLPSAQIMPITGTQDYGVVRGQGAPVSRPFRFIAGSATGGPGPGPTGGSCGDTVQAVLQLQDQGVDLGQITVPFQLGKPSHPLVEDFDDSLPASGLPAGWFSAALGTGVPWNTTTISPPNLPGAGEDSPGGEPPNNSAMVPDLPGQSYLSSMPFQVLTPQAQLYFREAFIVSNSFDGLILEIAIGTQPFQDILQAGGSFVMDGYNTVLNDYNPLGLRPAWSGDSGGWLPVRINLPPSAAGQSVQLRWHFAGSRGLPNGAWFVDSVLVTEPICLPPVSNPVILNPALRRGLFSFAINTVAGRNYIIEYKTNLTDPVWQTMEVLPGNGNQQIITVPTEPDRQGFYRFEVQ